MNRPAFAGHPIATGLLIATAVVWIALELRQSLNRRAGATSSDRRSIVVIRLVGGLAGVVAAVAISRATGATFGYNPWLFSVALALMWSGIALRWWSFHTLGRYFTFIVMTSPDQPVITEGPYRWLRHPSYLGILLALAGLGLTYGNWISLGALVLGPLLGVLYRIHVEEAALTRELGARYTDYARSRKRLVPYVW